MCAGDHDDTIKPSLFLAVTNAKDGSALMTSGEIERLVRQDDESEAKHRQKQVADTTLTNELYCHC